MARDGTGICSHGLNGDSVTLCVHCYFGTAESGVKLVFEDGNVAFLCTDCWGLVSTTYTPDMSGFLVVCQGCAMVTVNRYKRPAWKLLVQQGDTYVDRG